jgi:putative colanic acid biosynthesis acetyltransferase WcaF
MPVEAAGPPGASLPGARTDAATAMRLDLYRPVGFDRGRPRWVVALWYATQILLAPLPGSWLRRRILSLFGARVGEGVVIKPRVRITSPWRLEIGDHAWIGEGAWIDNLGPVSIGSHCCVSQDVYLCTGSHDWRSPTFDLMVRPIVVEPGAWLAARSSVAPGVTVGRGAVLALGSVAVRDLEPGHIHQGCPAVPMRRRS